MLRLEVALARKLRRATSLPEGLLWQQIQARKLGARFRRQHPVGPYIADVYSADGRLVIEVDGEIHNRGKQPQRDASRNHVMTDNGYRVLRIGAADILRDMEAVTTAIRAHAAAPLHRSPSASGPPPRAGEE